MPFDLSTAVPVEADQGAAAAMPTAGAPPIANAAAAPAQGLVQPASSTAAQPQQDGFDLSTAMPMQEPQQNAQPGSAQPQSSPGWLERLRLPQNDPNSVENTIRRAVGAPAVGANPGYERALSADSPFPDVMPTSPTLLKDAASAVGSGIKYLLRGGEQNIPAVAGKVADAIKAGTSLSVGQATGNRAMQAAESFAGKYPGSAGVMAKKGTTQASEIGAQVEKLADDLSPNASPSVAGRTIEKGLSGPGGFVSRFKDGQKALYDKLDQYIKPQTAVNVGNTAKALASMNENIEGAEALSKFFKNGKIQDIESALKADTAGAAPGVMKVPPNSPTRPGGLPSYATGKNVGIPGGSATNQLPYEAVKKLRTLVGDEISNNSLMSDVPRSKWKALYASLSSDLDDAARATGNADAVKSMERANRFSRAGYDRIGDVLDKVAKQDIPEKVFKSAVNPSDMQAGATKIQGIMKSLTPAERDVVKSAFVRRMGTAAAGAQGAAGDIFSSQTFLTNWNKMSPAAKDVMFSSQGGNLRASLDSIAKTAETIKEGGKVFANPSGSGQIVAASQLAGGIAGAAASGHLGAAAALVGTTPAAFLTAKLMTNARFVGWLARASKSVGPVAARQAAIALGKTMQGEPEDVQQDASAYAKAVTQGASTEQPPQ